MNNSVKCLAEIINDLIPNIKAGTLRFFGVWFGKPYDNYHKIITAEAVGNSLLIKFNEDEILEVSEPEDCEFSLENFEIKCAKRIIWKWFNYGMPKTPENLFSYKFDYEGGNIIMMCDANWFVENQKPQTIESAVKIY